jgi:hypothetical protein
MTDLRCEHKHLDELRAADEEERYVGFARDGASEERLACARRPYRQDTSRNAGR